MEDRIQELRGRLKAARDAYYNLSPVISDQEYDALRDELSRLSPNDEEVHAVGAEVPKVSVWDKVKHEIPMGSLSKANSDQELEEWLQRADESNAKSFFITHKIDGSSMELVYKNGKLTQCVTRGDGIVGEDVTFNMSKVPSIPKELSDNINITVRGEIVMLKSTFQSTYSSEYANPRNTAAGKVREKKGNGEACKDLVFMAYRLYAPTAQSNTMFSAMVTLQKLGFNIPEFITCPDFTALKAVYLETLNKRDSIPYEIDGMVVSVNDISILDDMGETNMRPKGQIAWKFDAAMAETKVSDVKWQIGPSGRITPVAILEPVSIGGVTITNVSMHNISMFRELQLYRGCKVLISRRNDVIPYIERRID